MTHKASRVKHAVLVEIASQATPPSGTLDVVACVTHTPGGKIPGTDYPNGLGGKTQYGAAWFDGLKDTGPIGQWFDSQADAYELIRMLTGEEGELWQRKQARLERIAAIEAAEVEAEKAAREATKERARLVKKGVDLAEATGGGSSRRSRSSERPTGTTGRRSVVRRKS